MASSPKRIRLSLEPIPIIHDDGVDDIFARPPRLLDINLEDGTEIYTREDPKKSISERLKRIWAERGDFSALTAESILAPPSDDDDEKGKGKEQDTRPSPQDMREIQTQLMDQLSAARLELTTALDLLSILAPPTDPPSVDVDSLPLPPQTLTTISVLPQPAPSGDLLPLATSLASLRSCASAFFKASEPLFTSTASEDTDGLAPSPPAGATRRVKSTTSDNWSRILQLRSTTPYSLIPLGAFPGASFSGKGEARAARRVGIFYGCPEAKEGFRLGAIAQVTDLKEEEGAEQLRRTLVIKCVIDGVVESVNWDGDVGKEGEEGVLRTKARATFAEELFALLTNEARTDATLKARLALGKKSEGDSVSMESHGWSFSTTMIATSALKRSPTPSPAPTVASLLLPLLRLLLLQEYAHRRSPSSPTPNWIRPSLSTISVLLSHIYRLRRLTHLVESIQTSLRELGAEVELEYFGAGPKKRKGEREDLAECVLRILRGDRELGGRIVLRVNKTRVFHISHSLLLPQPPLGLAGAPAIASHQPLVLQSPGGGPISIPSLSNLELFLREQLFDNLGGLKIGRK